jgi:hypothetical protein
MRSMLVPDPDDPRFRGDGLFRPFTGTGDYPVQSFTGNFTAKSKRAIKKRIIIPVYAEGFGQ